MPYALAVQSTTGPHTVDQWDLCGGQVIHMLEAAVFPIPISPKLITLQPRCNNPSRYRLRIEGLSPFPPRSWPPREESYGFSLCAPLRSISWGDNGEIEIHAAIHDLQLKPMLAGKVANSRSLRSRNYGSLGELPPWEICLRPRRRCRDPMHRLRSRDDARQAIRFAGSIPLAGRAPRAFPMSLSALSDYRSCLVKRPPAFVRGLM